MAKQRLPFHLLQSHGGVKPRIGPGSGKRAFADRLCKGLHRLNVADASPQVFYRV
jgi:hypothetical protein